MLTIARNELRQLGLDRTSAAAPVREAVASRDAEPWLPGNVGALLTAARSPELPAELVGLAPSASTADLLAWVEQAQLPQPAGPEALGVAVARTAAEALNGEHAEQLLVLNGLRRELEAAGPWWWPGSWRRHGELRARIAQRAQVAERLRVQADRADAEFGRAVRQHQADRAAWDATHGVVISRGAAAVQELQRREDALLDDYLYDPPSTCWRRSGRRLVTGLASGRGANRHCRWSGRGPLDWPWSTLRPPASPVAEKRTSLELGSQVTAGWRTSRRAPRRPRSARSSSATRSSSRSRSLTACRPGATGMSRAATATAKSTGSTSPSATWR